MHVAQCGQIDRRWPALRAVGQQLGLLTGDTLANAGDECPRLLPIERQLCLRDLQQALLCPEPSEGQVRRGSRGNDDLKGTRQVLQQRTERIQTGAVDESVDVVQYQDAWSRPTMEFSGEAGHRLGQDARPRRP